MGSLTSPAQRGERGAVTSLAAVALVLGAVVLTAVHVVPLVQKMHNQTELNLAFSLSAPRAVRAATVDSAGKITLLNPLKVEAAVLGHLKLFQANVESERANKKICAVVYDVGVNPSSISPEIQYGPVRSDGSDCGTVPFGPIYSTLVSQASNDFNLLGSINRYYFVVYDSTAPQDFQRISRVDTAPQEIPVTAVAWQPPTNTTGPGQTLGGD